VELKLHPSSDGAIQIRDELLLRCGAVAPHEHPEILQVFLLSVLAWLDEDLEPNPIMAIVTRAMLPGLDLTDRETEEVEPHRHPQRRVEGVADPSLRGLEFQAHLFQPLCCHLPHLLDDAAIRVQHHEVSSQGESHPLALAEPGMNLAAHPAPIVQPSGSTPSFQ